MELNYYEKDLEAYLMEGGLEKELPIIKPICNQFKTALGIIDILALSNTSNGLELLVIELKAKPVDAQAIIQTMRYIVSLEDLLPFTEWDEKIVNVRGLIVGPSLTEEAKNCLRLFTGGKIWFCRIRLTVSIEHEFWTRNTNTADFQADVAALDHKLSMVLCSGEEQIVAVAEKIANSPRMEVNNGEAQDVIDADKPV